MKFLPGQLAAMSILAGLAGPAAADRPKADRISHGDADDTVGPDRPSASAKALLTKVKDR